MAESGRLGMGYYSVVRGDGSFLQMARLDLEFKRPEWDAPRRGTLPRALNELFQRFAEWEELWNRGRRGRDLA